MNWNLIFKLSMFALAMGIATVFVIPSNMEPLFWLPIFLICAFLIAKNAPGQFFLHGLALGLINCLWVTGAHILLFDQYAANHAAEAEMMKSMPMPDSPRLMMALFGPMIGLVSGVVIGLFALAANKIVKQDAPLQARSRGAGSY
ncbi:MAG: hypothetical protein U0Q16_30235 [Bryobacteraceae bacterium]